MRNIKDKLLSELRTQLPGSSIINSECEWALDKYIGEDASLARGVFLNWTRMKEPNEVKHDIAVETVCDNCTYPGKNANLCDLQEALSSGMRIRNNRVSVDLRGKY